MQEIASAYRDVGLSGDFHSGAAVVYENLAHLKGTQPTRSAADMAGELADHAAKVMGAPSAAAAAAACATRQWRRSPARPESSSSSAAAGWGHGGGAVCAGIKWGVANEADF
jgi:hypothetical protein